MSANTVPRFIEQPQQWAVRVSAVTPAAQENGTGTLTTLVTGGAHGSEVEHYIVKGISDVEASRLFVFLASANTTYLLDELSVAATSQGSGATVGFEAEVTPTKPYIVPNNWTLKVGCSTSANALNVFAIGGDY